MGKPKIYATCPAGCLWETVHMEDFLQSAAHLSISKAEDGNFYLERDKLYKIIAPKSSGAFNCALTIDLELMATEALSISVDLPSDKYGKFFTFRLLDYTVTTLATVEYQLNIVYEVNGVRYNWSDIYVAATAIQKSYKIKVSSTSDETRVLLFNEEATLRMPNKEEIVAEVLAALPIYNGEVAEV